MQQHKRNNNITTEECDSVYKPHPPLHHTDQTVPTANIPKSLNDYPTDQQMEQYMNIIIGLGTNDITHQCQHTTAYDKDPDNIPNAIAVALSEQLTALVTITRVKCPNATIHILPIPPRSDAYGKFDILFSKPSQSRFANEVTKLLNDQIKLMCDQIELELHDQRYVKVGEYPSSLGTTPGKKNLIMRDAVHVSKAQSLVCYIMESLKD